MFFHTVFWFRTKKAHPISLFSVNFFIQCMSWSVYFGRGTWLCVYSQYRPWAWSFLGCCVPQLMIALGSIVTSRAFDASYSLKSIFFIFFGIFFGTMLFEVLFHLIYVRRPVAEDDKC